MVNQGNLGIICVCSLHGSNFTASRRMTKVSSYVLEEVLIHLSICKEVRITFVPFAGVLNMRGYFVYDLIQTYTDI